MIDHFILMHYCMHHYNLIISLCLSYTNYQKGMFECSLENIPLFEPYITVTCVNLIADTLKMVVKYSPRGTYMYMCNCLKLCITSYVVCLCVLCAFACVRVCVHACVCVCVRVRACVCACTSSFECVSV